MNTKAYWNFNKTGGYIGLKKSKLKLQLKYPTKKGFELRPHYDEVIFFEIDGNFITAKKVYKDNGYIQIIKNKKINFADNINEISKFLIKELKKIGE